MTPKYRISHTDDSTRASIWILAFKPIPCHRVACKQTLTFSFDHRTSSAPSNSCSVHLATILEACLASDNRDCNITQHQIIDHSGRPRFSSFRVIPSCTTRSDYSGRNGRTQFISEHSNRMHRSLTPQAMHISCAPAKSHRVRCSQRRHPTLNTVSACTARKFTHWFSGIYNPCSHHPPPAQASARAKIRQPRHAKAISRSD